MEVGRLVVAWERISIGNINEIGEEELAQSTRIRDCGGGTHFFEPSAA
jgi:hypothetical protein